MRILHTSDWHLGRNIENISREEEQREFENELCRIVRDNEVELVIIAGDIYDSFNPPVWAQRIFYETIKRLGDNGAAVVVISGNHDSPQGLCSAERLASGSGVIMCDYPGMVVKKGCYGLMVDVEDSGEGWFEIQLRNKKRAVIAAVPYPSDSRIGNLVEFSQGETDIKQDYNQRLKAIMQELTTHFKNDTVNILVSHVYINGGKPSDSERNFQLGGAYAVNSDTIPAGCDYVALGHLHRPQQISACMSPAYYSGSPLSYSFSETGYTKSVYLVDIENHKANVKAIPLSCGRRLVSIKADSIDEAVKWCEQNCEENIWAEIVIKTSSPITTEQQKLIYETCPGVVSIYPEIVGGDAVEVSAEKRLGKPLEESFADFYKQRMGEDMPENIKRAFAELRGEA